MSPHDSATPQIPAIQVPGSNESMVRSGGLIRMLWDESYGGRSGYDRHGPRRRINRPVRKQVGPHATRMPLPPLCCRLLVFNRWIPNVNSKRQREKVTFSYDGTGPESGNLCLSNGTCAFVVSDSAPSDELRARMPSLWHLPVLAGAVAIVFNLPDLVDLELRIPRDTLAAIFLGRIRRWSELARWNPKLEGVNESIALVVRSDESATTEALTSALSSFSSEWKGKVGTSSRPKWPGFAIRTEGDGGVALQLLRLPYSLGYMPLTNTFKVSTAFIENDAGQFVAPSANGVQAAMDDAVGKGFEEMGSRTKVLFLSIVDRKNTSDAYPIARLSYMAFEARALDCLTLEFVVYLLYWAWTDRRAAEIALQLSFAPISSGIRHSLLSLLQTLSCYAHDANETKQISNSMTILERVKYSISPIVMGAGASSP